MSMLNVESSLLGYRYTKWHGFPVAAVANGRVRSCIHAMTGHEENIYSYGWPMDQSAFSIGWSPYYGLQFQINPGTPPSHGSQDWNTSMKGFLEDTAIHFARFTKNEVGVFPEGLEAEMYVYCPNHTDFKDYMIVFWLFKNSGDSQISFNFAVFTSGYSIYEGVEKYVHPYYSAFVKSDGKTIIWGSDTDIQDCYMDGAWRTADYSDDTPDSNWLRWSITLDPGAEKKLALIIVFGDTETEAVNNYNMIRSWDHEKLLRQEIRFWLEWLDSGRKYSSGIWEIDQLARICLCLIKSFITQDTYTLPASLGPGYHNAHWPTDAWPPFLALLLWGHLDECKKYYGTAIKNYINYIVQNNMPLYKSIHICSLMKYTCGSGYTAADVFELVVTAVETWKRDKSDVAFRDDVWSWIQIVMDEIDGDIITTGEWKDNFNHNNICDVWEDWLILAPDKTLGNNIAVASCVSPLIAWCYENAASLAEAIGEQEKADTWRSRARTIRESFKRFWQNDGKNFPFYWGDVTGYDVSEPLIPRIRLSWIGKVSDSYMRKALRLFYDNYYANYDELITQLPRGNWMYGKVERDPSGYCSDTYLWDPFVAAAYLGFDNLIEDFLERLLKVYGDDDIGLFEESPTWNGQPSHHYHMIRSMGIFLVGYAYAFGQDEMILTRPFKLHLRHKGKEVTILKQTGTSTDTFGNVIASYEPVYCCKAFVQPLRADEKIVQAGFASIDDLRVFFPRLTLINAGDRIRIDGTDYAVQTVTKHYCRSRVVMKEVIARRVIE